MSVIRERPEILRHPDTGTFEAVRTAEEYGDIKLSVQAGRTHYCRPRIDGLNLSEYEAVEVAIIGPNGWLRPADIGLEELDDKWEPPTPANAEVGPYIDQGDVEAIRERLKEMADDD